VLLVSHQPFVGELISLLQHGHCRQPQPMQTASLAELEGEWPLAGSLRLLRVWHP
jgi:phosphohistidine phosphatase